MASGLVQEIWIRNRQTHMVNAFIGNERDKATGSTVEQKLHNIDLTNILLCKMKVRDEQMCSYCNDVVDYIEHFFFECPTIQKFWNYIEKYILLTFEIQTHLTVFDVLFRIKQNNCEKVKSKRKISCYINSEHLCISIYKKTNAFPPLSIFENQLRL